MLDGSGLGRGVNPPSVSDMEQRHGAVIIAEHKVNGRRSRLDPEDGDKNLG